MAEQDEAPTLNLKQTVNRLKDISDELERLDGKAKTNDNQLSNEDETYWGELTVEMGQLAKHRKQLVRSLDRQALRDALDGQGRGRVRVEAGSDGGELDSDPLGENDSIEDRRFRNPWDLSEIRTFNRTREEVGVELRSRAISAVELMQGMNQSRREAATKILEEFDNEEGEIARYALATSSPVYMRAFAKAMKGRQSTFTPEEAASIDRAMGLTDNVGGFAIPFQLDPTIIITSAGSFNDVRSVARQVVATGDVWNGVSAAAVTWTFQPEATEATDNAPAFAGPAITLRKAHGFVPISHEAFQDITNVTSEVGRLLAFGKDTLESTVFTTGAAASNQPIGIVTALTGTASEINAAADDTFAIGDVYTIEGALPARHRRNASWMANNSIYNLIRRFDTSGGGGFWANLGQGRPPELLGRRAIENEAMDGTVTTTGAVSNMILIFGDFENYVIADRIGMTIEMIPNLVGGTANFPTGQRGFYAWYRVGADSVDDGAFRMLDVASAA